MEGEIKETAVQFYSIGLVSVKFSAGSSRTAMLQ